MEWNAGSPSSRPGIPLPIGPPYSLSPIDSNSSHASNPHSPSNAQNGDSTQGTTPNSAPHASPPANNPQSANDNAPTKPQTTPHGLNPRSCNTCRRRKVKCDKIFPCSNCTKAHTECVFPGPGRAPRRMKEKKQGAGSGQSDRETELLKRLRRLEGVVEELSGQVEIEAGRSNGQNGSPLARTDSLSEKEKDVGADGLRDKESPRSAKPSVIRVKGMDEGNAETRTWLARIERIGGGPPKSEDMLDKGAAKVVVTEGRSRYISNEFWARLNMEVADIRELADGYSDPPTDDDEAPDSRLLGLDYETEENHQGFILGYSSSTVDLKPLHPLPSQIPFYWQTFVENVDPLVKIMHIPTMAKTIKEVQENVGSLSRSTEALMFSIYLGAVTSMTVEEVKNSFGQDKDALIRKYRFGTEQALARAGFLTSSEIVTVQAFVLFLICVRRHDDSRSVWSLTGLVIRLAQALGLHRDGEKLGLSMFDTEMRRRLWWQITVLDIRAAEDFGTDPSITEFSADVKLPSNLNDADFGPTTENWPEVRVGVSEMTFCLIRYEICSMSRRLSYIPPNGPCRTAREGMTLADKEKFVRDLHDHLETTYLQYCDTAGALYWVAATVARLIMSKMSLIIYGFRDPDSVDQLPQSVKNRLFIAAIEIMEYSRLLETEISTKKWGWLFHTYVQWHAIAYILKEVCVRPSCEITERGWKAVDAVFSGWSEALKKHQTNSQLWTPIRKLMIKARRIRQANLEEKMKKAAVNPQSFSCQPASTSSADATRSLDESLDFNNIMLPPAPQSDPRIWNTGLAYQPSIGDINIFETGPSQDEQQNLQQQNAMYMSHDNTNIGDGLGFLGDSSALVGMDLDMADGSLDDINWAGWDDAVRDFSLQSDQELGVDARGPNLNGMGSWW